MSDLAKEIANTVVRIKTEMRKASFASRSEAGRYAANQRWKGQGKKGKTALDDLSIRGMTQTKWNIDELRTHIDEQEGLLEAMRDNGASKAELKQQKGLITLARRDLRRMEGSETKVEPKTPKSNKNISRQEASAVERVDLFMRSTANLDQSVLDRMAAKYNTGAVSDADRKLLDETKKEMLAAGEAAKTAIRDAFAAGGRDATDKLGKTFASVSRKTAKQMVAEGLTQKSPSDPKPEITIRGTILQTKVMVFDRLVLQLKDIPKALTDSYGVGKAQFASRSEAGRYAANMRWKGQGQATSASGQLAGTPQSANVSLVMAVKAPTLFGSTTEEVDEDTFEEAQIRIEMFLDELKVQGTDILGKKSFDSKFGREIDSIKDTLHEMKWESPRRSMPTGSLNRAKVLQEQISEAASKIDFTPRDRMRAEAILQQYDEQIQSLGRAGTRLTERQNRDQVSYIEKVNGGRKVLEAGSRERALGIIAELNKGSVKYMQRARQYEFKATGAEAPRFKNLARTANAQMHQYADQQAGAEMVFEALYDEQLEKAQFASRSEAARYAANQRWKGQGKKTAEAKERLSASGKYKITPAIGKVIDQGFITLSSKRKVTVTAVPGKEGYYTVDLPSHKAEFYLPTAIQKNSDGSPATHVGLSVEPKWSPNESVIRGASRAETEEDMARIVNDEIGLISRLDQENGYEPPIDYPGKPLYRVAIHSTASTDVVIEKMTRNGWEQQAIQSVADEDGQEYEEGLEGRVVAKFQANLKAKAKENQWNYDPVVAWS